MENKAVESYLQKLQEDFLEEVDVATFANRTIIKLSQGETTVAALVAAAAIAWVAFKGMGYLVTSKVCRSYKPASRQWQICESKVNIANNKKKIAALGSKVYLCNNSKQPEKCKAKIKEKADKLRAKNKKWENKIKRLEKEVKF